MNKEDTLHKPAATDVYNMLPAVPSVVFNEDCEVGLKRFPDKYFDLAICDIPYGIDVANMAYLKEMKTTVKQKNGTTKTKSHIRKSNGTKSRLNRATLMNCRE